MDMPQKSSEAEVFYTKLAGAIDPQKLLLFYWNGSGIVLFGDHRYMTGIGRPKPEMIAALKQKGFHWLGYHPYVLVYAPQAMQAQLAKWGPKGEIPAGYKFTPDYGGPADRFPECFRGVSTGYYKSLDKAELWVVHPASRLGRSTWCGTSATTAVSTTWTARISTSWAPITVIMFPTEKEPCEGTGLSTWRGPGPGRIGPADPDLAPMSEVESAWTCLNVLHVGRAVAL